MWQCSFVCPHGVIRSKLYDKAKLDERPPASVGADRRPRLPRHPLHPAGLRRGLHRLRPVRRGLPGASRGGVGKSHQHGGKGADPREREHANWPSSRRCRSTTAPTWTTQRRGIAVPAAAVRVLRRLRRLRRDAVHLAGLAAVRRPADGSQRHRLLVDLRRQPADHTVDGEQRRPRARLVELAVRGQRRVRPGLAPRRRPAHGAGEDAADADGADIGDDLVGEIPGASQATSRRSAANGTRDRA